MFFIFEKIFWKKSTKIKLNISQNKQEFVIVKGKDILQLTGS